MIWDVFKNMVREDWNWYKSELETLIWNYSFSIKVILCIKYKVVCHCWKEHVFLLPIMSVGSSFISYRCYLLTKAQCHFSYLSRSILNLSVYIYLHVYICMNVQVRAHVYIRTHTHKHMKDRKPADTIGTWQAEFLPRNTFFFLWWQVGKLSTEIIPLQRWF